MTQYIVSRQTAIARGLKTYTGKPCKYGHGPERYTSNGNCIACDRGDPPGEVEEEKPKVLLTAATGFVWTDAIRQHLIDGYIDTGDIEGARQSVSLAPSEYRRELARNPEFKAAMDEAEKLAMQTLEEKALHEAALGNDKLILAVLKAKHPEQYTERGGNRAPDDQKKPSHEEIDRQLKVETQKLLRTWPEFFEFVSREISLIESDKAVARVEH